MYYSLRKPEVKYVQRVEMNEIEIEVGQCGVVASYIAWKSLKPVGEGAKIEVRDGKGQFLPGEPQALVGTFWKLMKKTQN